jgi:hypothetical protein
VTYSAHVVTCNVTATGWVVLSGARIGEGEGVGRREMLEEAEGIGVWDGGLEDVLGVPEALVGPVREERSAHASWRGRLRIIFIPRADWASGTYSRGDERCPKPKDNKGVI